jgi:hypothetical protein
VFRTREGNTIGQMVLHTVLSDITCQRDIHMVKWDKERFTKLISISMGKPLTVRGRSGLFNFVVVVI